MLSTIPLFKGLGPTELDWIAHRARKRMVPVGVPVLLADQLGEAIYVIITGTVKIHIEQASGRDVVLSIIGAGDLLGEISLLDSSGHSATAVTLENSQLLWMDKPSFKYILDEFPRVSRNLVNILASRLRMNNELIRALATLDVHGRVARQLLAFADKYGETLADNSVMITISITQGDMADLVGATRKSVNQVMVFFRKQNYISMDVAGKIILHDRTVLAKYCA
jgi:CRP/FNR family cyclic AMP-dependent transcriptional regulator